MYDIQAINFSLTVCVEHDLDRTDQVIYRGLVTKVGRCTNNVAAHSTEEADRFGANQHQVHFDVVALCVSDLTDHFLEQVGVEATAKTTICRNYDVACALGLALRQERVLRVRVGCRHMTDNTADSLGIRSRRLHLSLRFTDLARSDFLHRAGDLLHVFYRSDLRAYFLFTCHRTS